MTKVFRNMLVSAAILASSPCAAAVVFDNAAVGGAKVSVSAPATETRSRTLSKRPAKHASNSIATRAGMLPSPATGLFVVVGFLIIAYATRSRKGARVNFN